MYAIGISAVIQMIMLSAVKDMAPVLPEFGAYFPNTYIAMVAQYLLIGLISAVFGAGSVIMEFKRLGLVGQSILYFLVTAAVWIPVGCLCWGLHRYPQAALSVGISYIVSYVICWVIQYCACKRNIEQINRKLSELRTDAGRELMQ